MRRMSVLLLTIMLLLVPTTAFADSREWTADPPKQPGLPVIWCTATATAGGDTYTMHNYAPLDDNFDAHRYAQRVFTDDVVRAMLYAFPGRSHAIQRSDVTVTCK
jgi:hypothetical protein